MIRDTGEGFYHSYQCRFCDWSDGVRVPELDEKSEIYYVCRDNVCHVCAFYYCVYCDKLLEEHIGDKCLFDATTFRSYKDAWGVKR